MLWGAQNDGKVRENALLELPHIMILIDDEKKEKSIPLVVASEKGIAQTNIRIGVVGPYIKE